MLKPIEKVHLEQMEVKQEGVVAVIKRFAIALSLLFLVVVCRAQEEPEKKKKSGLKPFSKEVVANFMSSYYNQNGDNAAVTGGKGTEELTDASNIFTISIPVDSLKQISVTTGFDYYSSASTDNIDNSISSASSSDIRAYANGAIEKRNLKKGEIYSANIGLSAEYDVTSFSAGLGYTKLWNEANTQLSFSGNAIVDNWQLIYPIELRGRVELKENRRMSYSLGTSLYQILNKRTVVSISAEAIQMNGLLSTPFHRVYFSDVSSPDIERLPNSRLKVPVSLRLNYMPLDNLVIRTFLRRYWDDFGISANTLEIETPITIKRVFTLSPFYRYHNQTAAKYFKPFQGHLSTEEFYTSDYDLSDLSSDQFGLGLKYYPLYGVFRSKPISKKKRIAMLKYISLRGSSYSRSTGLNFFMAAIDLGFALE